MRNLTFTFVLLVVSTIVMAFTSYTRNVPEISYIEEEIKPLTIKDIPVEITTSEFNLNVKDHSKFLNDIGFRESSGNYKAVNQYGYLGKYQFGRKTLDNLGYENISNSKFLNSPTIQEQAMYDLLVHNKEILKNVITKFEGKIINGILITESGILAAAHLAGPGNVKKYLRRGKEFEDGNGTSLSSYLKNFKNYKLDL